MISTTVAGACSLPRLKPSGTGVWKEFEPYLKEYTEIAKHKGIDLSDKSKKLVVTKANKLMDNSAAVCHMTPLGNEVEVSEIIWSRISEIERKQLAFHELVHCLCDRMHTYQGGEYPDKAPAFGFGAGYMDDGCPSSMMHPTMIDRDCAVRHWNEYIDEMMVGCEP